MLAYKQEIAEVTNLCREIHVLNKLYLDYARIILGLVAVAPPYHSVTCPVGKPSIIISTSMQNLNTICGTYVVIGIGVGVHIYMIIGVITISKVLFISFSKAI